MAISVSKAPDVLSMAGCPVLFELFGSLQYSAAGSAALLIIQFSGNPVNTNVITIVAAGVTHTFTCKTSPDDSGYEFPANLSQDPQEAITTIAEWIYKNYFIQRDYNYEIGTLTIIFTAKEKGTLYNISLGSSYQGVTANTTTAGVDTVLRENYNILALLQTLDYEDVIYKTQSEDYLQPNAAGSVFHDVSQFVYVRNDSFLIFPPLENTNNVTGMLTTFRLRVSEIYGAPPVSRALLTDEPYYALPGNLNTNMLAKLNELTLTFSEYLKSKKRFLTNQPRTKYINIYSPEKLWWFAFDNISDARLKCILYFDDDDVIDFLFDVIGTDPDNNLYEFNLNPRFNEMHLESPTGAGLVKIEAFLFSDNDDIISEIFTYIVEDEHYLDRHFIFRNSYGVYECCKCTGVSEQSIDFDREFVNNNLGDNFMPKAKETNQAYIETKREYKLSTGYFEKEHEDWWLEFMASPDVYLVHNNRLYPVVLTNKDVSCAKDNEHLHAFRFSFMPARSETGNFSDYLDNSDLSFSGIN
jgi:hypothetical protein